MPACTSDIARAGETRSGTWSIIIDLKEMVRGLLRAAKFFQRVAASNGLILFIGKSRPIPPNAGNPRTLGGRRPDDEPGAKGLSSLAIRLRFEASSRSVMR